MMNIEREELLQIKGKLQYFLKEVSPDCGSIVCKFRHKSKEIPYSQMKKEFCTCFLPEDSRENHLKCQSFAKLMKDFAEEFVNK